MGLGDRAETRHDRVAELIGLDHTHLGAVRGELVGEDVDIDEGDADALDRRDRPPPEPQRRLRTRSDLEQSGVLGRHLLESRERAVTRSVSQDGVEGRRGHRHIPDDAAEQERTVAGGVDVDAEHVPARLVVHQRERLDPATTRSILPGFR